MKPLLICSIATLGIVAGLGQTPAAPPAENKRVISLPELSSSFENLVNRIRPAVVQIFSTGYVAQEERDSGSASLLTKQRNTGSGVILSADGYIVTNAHVVRGARRIQVRLPAARETLGSNSNLIDAKVVGMDRDFDIAVIKIDQSGLPYLQLGDSDHVQQGELAMAFGNPLGLEGSVSMGIVSSTSRALAPDDMMLYIQTDAPINPGNSGGPLVDSQGQVIGLNTFILSQSGGSEGIGFAIPSNVVSNVYSQLRKDGHVHRARIGIHAQSITPLMAAGLNLPRDWGVVAADVTPTGPADQAGVKTGDIILTLNGKTMHNARQLEMEIYRYPTRQKVHLVVLRGSDQLTIEVPVIISIDDPQRFMDFVNPEENLIPRLGILAIGIDKKLADLVPDLRNPFGVVVAAGSTTDLSSGTGLQPGDVIYSVNGLQVASVAALKKKLDEFKPGQAVVMQIERSGRLMFVSLELE